MHSLLKSFLHDYKELVDQFSVARTTLHFIICFDKLKVHLAYE